jgi:hypothetical protein
LLTLSWIQYLKWIYFNKLKKIRFCCDIVSELRFFYKI